MRVCLIFIVIVTAEENRIHRLTNEMHKTFATKQELHDVAIADKDREIAELHQKIKDMDSDYSCKILC